MPEAHYPEGLAGEFLPAEELLLLLNPLLDHGIALIVVGFLIPHSLHVTMALVDPPRAKEQRAQNELLDGVGVRARGVEYRDSAVRHRLDGDVVGPCTAPGNGTHRARHLRHPGERVTCRLVWVRRNGLVQG